MSVARVVVGAAGFIGTHLCAALAHRPGSLLAIDTTNAPDDHPVAVIATGPDHPHFANLLATHLDGNARAELYYAAGHVPELAYIADTPATEFTATLTDNLTNPYAILQAFAETAKGLSIPAAAVVLSSAGAHHAHRYLVAYDAAKAGLESVVRTFALEYGRHLAIRSLALGPIAQSVSTAADGDRLPDLIRLVPRQRYLDIGEVVAAILALAAPSFDGATGQTLVLDGGLTVQLRPVQIERPPAVTT